MKITFLGTNGWYATGTGNSVCTVIETSFNYIVLDAGDGLYHLDLVATKDKPIDLFLSHFHLDHIIGLHILPKFSFKNGIRIFGQKGSKKILMQIMDRPYTAPPSILKTKVTVNELCEGENEIPVSTGADSYKMTCLPLIHADPCIGFRFEVDGKIVAYCTDTGPCDNIIRLAKNSDLLITECALPPGTQPSKIWPHLNPELAAKAAKESGSKKLILTHFDAAKYDTLKKRKTAQNIARKTFPKTKTAVDGYSVELNGNLLRNKLG